MYLITKIIVPFCKFFDLQGVTIEKLLYLLNLNRECQNHIWEVRQTSRYDKGSEVTPGLQQRKNEKAFRPIGCVSSYNHNEVLVFLKLADTCVNLD